jgi:hypothetical protein
MSARRTYAVDTRPCQNDKVTLRGVPFGPGCCPRGWLATATSKEPDTGNQLGPQPAGRARVAYMLRRFTNDGFGLWRDRVGHWRTAAQDRKHIGAEHTRNTREVLACRTVALPVSDQRIRRTLQVA